MNNSVSVIGHINYFTFNDALAKHKFCADFRTLAGFAKTLPNIVFTLIEKQKLNNRTGFFLYTVDTRRNNPCVV